MKGGTASHRRSGIAPPQSRGLFGSLAGRAERGSRIRRTGSVMFADQSRAAATVNRGAGTARNKTDELATAEAALTDAQTTIGERFLLRRFSLDVALDHRTLTEQRAEQHRWKPEVVPGVF